VCTYSTYSISVIDLDTELKRFIIENSPYIKDYPPHFKSKKHKKVIIKKTKAMINKLDKTELNKENSIESIINAAQIYAMAHNLDLGTGTKAKEAFSLALKLQPENSKANYLYGMFLISTQKYQLDSEKYLLKAYSLGVEDALFSLGLIELMKGNKPKGIALLEQFSKKNPSNKYVLRILDGAKSNRIQFKKSQ